MIAFLIIVCVLLVFLIVISITSRKNNRIKTPAYTEIKRSPKPIYTEKETPLNFDTSTVDLRYSWLPEEIDVDNSLELTVQQKNFIYRKYANEIQAANFSNHDYRIFAKKLNNINVENKAYCSASYNGILRKDINAYFTEDYTNHTIPFKSVKVFAYNDKKFIDLNKFEMKGVNRLVFTNPEHEQIPSDAQIFVFWGYTEK